MFSIFDRVLTIGNLLKAVYWYFDFVGSDNLVLLRCEYDLISRISKKSTKNMNTSFNTMAFKLFFEWWRQFTNNWDGWNLWTIPFSKFNAWYLNDYISCNMVMLRYTKPWAQRRYLLVCITFCITLSQIIYLRCLLFMIKLGLMQIVI